MLSRHYPNPPKHINIGQYLYSNVPSLKEFCEPATKLQEGMSALKALSTVMLLLQRYEFKASHENWVNTVKPKLGLDISTRVLRAVNFAHDNIKSLYAIRNELRAVLKNLLKVVFHLTLVHWFLTTDTQQREFY
jgi:hypothetical protein